MYLDKINNFKFEFQFDLVQLAQSGNYNLSRQTMTHYH